MGHFPAPERYRIVPKRDFGSGPGYWMKGAGNVGTGKYGFVKRGFVVVDGNCRIVNVMPGAAWFRSIADAFRAIACLELAYGDSDQFWHLLDKTAGGMSPADAEAELEAAGFRPARLLGPCRAETL